MPLYEYECKKCKRRMEKIRKFSDPPLTVCEKCGGKLEQLISSPAIQFKGAGWYVTDYAKKSTASSSKSSDNDGGSKDSSKDKDSKDSKDSKESKETKKDDKPKTDSSSKKHKKD